MATGVPQAEGNASSSDVVGNETPLTVFVSDPSAEAERMTQALRAAGYSVVDVPLSMLIARVAVQIPRVILVDADAEGALDAVSRLRDLPDAESIDVVFVGKEGAVFQSAEEALAHEGSGFFTRPVDVQGLVRKVHTLTGGPVGKDAPAHPSAPPAATLHASPQIPLGETRPVSLPPASMRLGSDPPRGEKRMSDRPPPASRAMSGPGDAPAAAGASEVPKRSPSIQAPLSSELESLLAEAEQRMGVQMLQESIPPSPEEEIEAVLPAEILSALDEPLDEEDEDDLDLPRGVPEPEGRQGIASRQVTSSGRSAETGPGDGDSAQAKTHGGRSEDDKSAMTGTRTGPSVVETSQRVESQPREGALSSQGAPQREAPAAPPPLRVPQLEDATMAPSVQLAPQTEYQGSPMAFTGLPPALPALSGGFGSTLGSGGLEAHAAALQEIVSPPVPSARGPQPSSAANTAPEPARSRKAESVPPPGVVPQVLGERDAPLAVARSISLRSTGALCIEAEDGVRRIVFREGDIVTAASGVDSESLLAFLGGRGELPRETIQQLAGKVPPFGRHAGAALVAHGHLRQDQLWPVLRAHAEWILGRVMLVARGTALLEPEPPGRLKGEPSVFGGSTGAEVLIEELRRVVAPDEAIRRLGGAGSRVAQGTSASLLSECALDASERDLVTRLTGATVGDLTAAAAEADFASVVYGLSLLGVVEIIRAVSGGAGPASRGAKDLGGESPVDSLDEDAIRERVRARLALVEEGDYFALLGLSPDATGYEVRRAFLELRRAFDPERVLTPQIADLEDDVRKIVIVLEEAYEILRDNTRRERYRRAIVATPEI